MDQRNFFIVTAIGCSLLLGMTAFAADQKVTLMLGGKHCDSYLNDVETALKKVDGVKKADVKSMPGHAVVETDAAKVKPDQLVTAVNGVKGSGYNCSAEVMK